MKGSHFYGASQFCMGFLQSVPETVDQKSLNRVRLNQARAYRMMGAVAKAIEIFEDLRSFDIEKHQKDLLLMELALAYAHDGNSRAVEVAKELFRKTKNPSQRLHARSIIIGEDKADPQRTVKLDALEKEARRKKAFIVANNIAITLARESADTAEARKYLSGVVSGNRDHPDFYNQVRAYVEIADRQLEDKQVLDDGDHVRLIAAYQYVFNQRIPALFDKCHRALWKSFTARDEIANLFALFRHSSFIWRIRGASPNERDYIARLTKLSGNKLIALPQSRDESYFHSRVENTPVKKLSARKK